jgi:hypothetical protein
MKSIEPAHHESKWRALMHKPSDLRIVYHRKLLSCRWRQHVPPKRSEQSTDSKMYDPVRGRRCRKLLVSDTQFCLYRRPQSESSLSSSVNRYAPTRQPLSAAKVNSYMQLHYLLIWFRSAHLGILSSEVWWLRSEVSEQPIGPIFTGKATIPLGMLRPWR